MDGTSSGDWQLGFMVRRLHSVVRTSPREAAGRKTLDLQEVNSENARADDHHHLPRTSPLHIAQAAWPRFPHMKRVVARRQDLLCLCTPLLTESGVLENK